MIDILRVFDQENEKEKKLYSNIFDLLSHEIITTNGKQFSISKDKLDELDDSWLRHRLNIFLNVFSISLSDF